MAGRVEGGTIIPSAPAWMKLIIAAVISPIIRGAEIVNTPVPRPNEDINVLDWNCANAALSSRIERGSIVVTAPVSIVVVQGTVVTERISRCEVIFTSFYPRPLPLIFVIHRRLVGGVPGLVMMADVGPLADATLLTRVKVICVISATPLGMDIISCTIVS